MMSWLSSVAVLMVDLWVNNFSWMKKDCLSFHKTIRSKSWSHSWLGRPCQLHESHCCQDRVSVFHSRVPRRDSFQRTFRSRSLRGGRSTWRCMLSGELYKNLNLTSSIENLFCSDYVTNRKSVLFSLHVMVRLTKAEFFFVLSSGILHCQNVALIAQVGARKRRVSAVFLTIISWASDHLCKY